MKKQVLINVEDKDVRVAVLEDGELIQLFIEPLEEKSIVGNVYKGRVDSIVAGLQAVFVDIGQPRNAFLHFADICGDYTLPEKYTAQQANDRMGRAGGRSRRSGPKKDAEELKSGSSILVQVTKEPISTKGARVTTNISLPGRFLVLLPTSEKNGGVSRRIENESERRRLRKILRDLQAEEGGFIVRTAGLDHDEHEISADVKRLQNLWEQIGKAAEKKKAPALVHDDHEILGRIVRDELTDDVDDLIIDSYDHADLLRDALANMMPELQSRVRVHEAMEENLFDRYDVENQFQKALRRKVFTKSGGSIVIDETEALIAIDVNTGKFTGKGDQEETIYKTNLEAAETVARQLRLRDVGGLIVIDFIDMRSRENQRNVVKHLVELLKKDRAKFSVSSISEFGLLEMTRKRVRQSLDKVIFRQCPHCAGSGRTLQERYIWKNLKYEILSVMRRSAGGGTLRVTMHPEMRKYLQEHLMEAAKTVASHGRTVLEIYENERFHLEEYQVLKED